MEQRSVQVGIQQRIDYHQTDLKDEWELTTQGQLIHLKTYSRLTYEDREGLKIQLKWYESVQEEGVILEIKQPGSTLVFNPYKSTYSSYLTPQGEWTLEVITHSLSIEDGKIHLAYQIKTHDDLLGNYQFRLQYQG